MVPETAAKTMVGLPMLVVSPVDVGRLIRELEEIDEQLLQVELRNNNAEKKLPRTTNLLDQLAALNKVNLLVAEDRKAIIAYLYSIKAHSPVMHISFSADPSTSFIEKLMAWLRREIHPLVLVTVGLQPTIGAGCIFRSPNKQFDFSLRQDFAKKRDLLAAAIGAGTQVKAPAPVVPVTATQLASVPTTVAQPVEAVAAPAAIPAGVTA